MKIFVKVTKRLVLLSGLAIASFFGVACNNNQDFSEAGTKQEAATKSTASPAPGKFTPQMQNVEARKPPTFPATTPPPP